MTKDPLVEGKLPEDAIMIPGRFNKKAKGRAKKEKEKLKDKNRSKD
ncbi:MAG: hypothetical protein ABH867_01095 [Patescibacteria group bacterium]